MLIQKIIDTTEPGAAYEINKHIANGWYIAFQGITMIIFEKEV